MWRDNGRRVRTHEKNSGETVRRLGTIIQSYDGPGGSQSSIVFDSPVMVLHSPVMVLHSPVMVLHSLVLVFTQSSFNFYTVQFYFFTQSSFNFYTVQF